MLRVCNSAEIDQHLETVRQSAAISVNHLTSNPDRPLDLFWRMKFELLGQHPIEKRRLNLVEQINQTWTFIVALEAARKLLQIHQDEVFQLAPGAYASLPFDIINLNGDIGAETFAAVMPDNNNKLEKDIAKLERHPEIMHRYVFFISPSYQTTQRQEERERSGIQVWSIARPQ